MITNKVIQAVKSFRNASLLLKSVRKSFCEGPKHHKVAINEETKNIIGNENSQELEDKEFEVAVAASSMDEYELNESNSNMNGMLDQVAEQHDDSNIFEIEDEYSGLLNNNNMEDISFGQESTSQRHRQSFDFNKQHKHKHYQESLDKNFNEEDRLFGEFFEKYSKRIFLEMTKPQLDEVKQQFSELLDVLSQKHLKGDTNEDTNTLDTTADHSEKSKSFELSKQQLLTMRLSADFLSIFKKQLNQDESQEQSAWISQNSKTLLALIHQQSQLSVIQEHPKEYFTMVQNYFQNQIFNIEEQDNLLQTVVIPNITLLPVSALVKFIQLFKNIEKNENNLNNSSFIEAAVQEVQINRLNGNLTINECLLIQDLLQFSEIRSKSQFFPQFLEVYQELWYNMNPHQLINVSNLLKRVKQSDNQGIFDSFKNAVTTNLHKFNQFQITNLLQFFNSITKSTNLSENSSILHDLNSRRFELKRTAVQKYLHYFESKELREVIDKKILENIIELAQVQNQLDFFRLSQGFSKKQLQKIISSIYEENSHLVGQKQDILNHRINDFEVYSGVLLRLGLRDEDILNSLSQQLQTNDNKMSHLSLKDQMSLASNFTQLGMQYPFFEELKQQFLLEIDSYDFTDINSWENALQLTAYSSQYSDDTQSSIELAQKIEPYLISNISDVISNEHNLTTKDLNFQDSKKQIRQKKSFLSRLDKVIELLTYMPENTFKTLSSQLLSVNNKEGVFKKNYFKYMSILLQKGIISYQFLESNPKRLSYFLSSKEYYLSSFQSLSRHSKALSVPQLDFAHSLVYEINRQSKSIQLVPVPHLIGSFQATFILQSSTKTVHLDLLTSKDVFVNNPRVLVPSAKLKMIMLEKSNINYDYVAQVDFFGKDRDILVKDLISKHFGALQERKE